MIDFTSKTYQNLLQAQLDRVPNSLDKREGSLIQTAIGAGAYALEEFYLELDQVRQGAYLQTAVGEELRYLAEAMDQIHRNLFVQTMDEGTCAQWEAILRILPTPEEDLDFRRLRVLNRLALRPPFTLIFLRQKLDLIFGPGNYRVEVDYPNYTLYIETSMNNQRYFGEVSALLSIVKPCHIVYIAHPRIDAGLRLAERVASGELTYNYILGSWALGEKPFVSCVEQEVLKMETAASIRPALRNIRRGSWRRMCTTAAPGEGYKFVK